MTAHNEHTGASMTTAGKGSLEKYARGWEGIFGGRVEEVLEVRVDGVSVEPTSVTFTGLKADEAYTLGVEVHRDAEGNVLHVEHREYGEPPVQESSAVMALDFHDSRPVRALPTQQPSSVP